MKTFAEILQEEEKDNVYQAIDQKNLNHHKHEAYNKKIDQSI